MKSIQLLKLLFLPCAALMWSSCRLPEDVVSSGEFQPLKTLAISPDSAKVGDNIIITGENFISKKEYNHVWFYPNVKAVIDSATKTQLFLKVPEGAVTGEVVVSNGAYADTVSIGFKVLREYNLNNLRISFGGINVKTSYWKRGYNGSQGDYNNSGSYSQTIKLKHDSLRTINLAIEHVNNYLHGSSCGFHEDRNKYQLFQYFKNGGNK